ncbi:protein-L-isoaspartate O-methyltransferase [Celeribacter arenosi]|uniref:Protein-L-isoaspartate O-methyltransferase n=1 Tax=Celeribacter arenosi TaxID=792649 RepID=A0ABP7K8Y9_9RHOB
MPDFRQLRTTMVDTQVRPSDVTKFPIIAAMLDIPREDFVPDAQRDTAYVGGDISLGGSRVVLDPRTFSKMLDALAIENNELVLDIGAGLGYSSAVIARMAQAVVALEENEEMAAQAASLLADHGADNVVIEVGALQDGEEQHGLYDVVMIEGGVEEIPEAILSQVKDGGRICAVFLDGSLGAVRLGYKIDGKMSWRMIFNATAPVMNGFEAKRAFAL